MEVGNFPRRHELRKKIECKKKEKLSRDLSRDSERTLASDIVDSVAFASSVVDGRLRIRHLFILMHNGGESKRSGRCEINMGRPLLQEEQSAKTSEHAASAKH